MTPVLKVNRQGQVIYFSFSEISDLRNVKIDTINLRHNYKSVMDGLVEGSLILNFKVIPQGHEIYCNSFEFYGPNYIENDTNLFALSHSTPKYISNND